MYKKRPGTSGISGQLYEMNIISYTLFGLLHDDNIEEFHLASNIDEIGTFDDVCFKVRIKGLNKPILVLIQAKHKEGDDKLEFDVSKNFPDSYSQVIQKFYSSSKSKSKDNIFTGKFDDQECIFILYTNAKYKNDSGIEWTSDYATVLNNLIATGKNGSQMMKTDKIIKESAETITKEELNTLAIRFAKFFNDNSNQSMNIMLDEYILKYHVILVRKVVEVSAIQCDAQKTDSKYRILTFRPDFFDTSDKHLILLKKSICKVVIKNQANKKIKNKTDDELTVGESLQTFFSNPGLNTLSFVLGTGIEHKNGKLELINRRVQNLGNSVDRLKHINLPQSVIEEAETIVARKILLSLKLKVPITFGNTDLVISERRVDHLTKSVINLCKKSKIDRYYNIITLDDNIEDGLMRLNGGLAGAVGNLLAYDQSTNLLKLTDILTPLQSNAKLLLDKLKTHLSNWDVYRFDVKATLPFAKLSFECRDIAEEILSRVVIYAQQSNHMGMQELLTKKIQKYHSTKGKNYLQVEPDFMFQSYRNEILKWWLLPEKGPYLTQESDIYHRAIKNIIIEPRITSLQTTFYMTKLNNIQYTVESLRFLDCFLKGTDKNEKYHLDLTSVVITDVISLTALKVIQYFRKANIDNYVILDLECILNLSIDDFFEMKLELKKTAKVLIILGDNSPIGNTLRDKYMEDVFKIVEEKQKVIIVNKDCVETVRKLLMYDKNDEKNEEEPNYKTIYDKNRLVDLNKESQRIVTENFKLLFQGQLVNLDMLIDDVSSAFIEGHVLNKIIQNESFEIGESLNDTNYTKIKDFYQDRRVEYVKSQLFLGRISVSREEDFRKANFTKKKLLNLNSYLLDETENRHDNDITAELNEHDRNDTDPNDITPEESENNDCKFKVQESANNYVLDDYLDICKNDLLSILKFLNCYVILDEDGCKHHIIFHFECCFDLTVIKSTEDLKLYDIRNLNGKPMVCSCFTFKKEEVQGKLWVVEIKLLGFLKEFSKWQSDKNMIADTLSTLKSMCQRYILTFLVQSKTSQSTQKVSDNLNVETINTVLKENLDEEKEYFWLRQHPSTIFAQNLDYGNNEDQNNIKNDGINDATSVDAQNINIIPEAVEENVITEEDLRNDQSLKNIKQDITRSHISSIVDEDSNIAIDSYARQIDSNPTTSSNERDNDDNYTIATFKMLKPGVLTDVIIGSYVVYDKVTPTKVPVNSTGDQSKCENATSSNTSKYFVKGIPLEYKPGLRSDAGHVDFLFRFHYNRCCDLKTFNDINDDVVHVTAPPGMGKSTLLTHLSLKTKKIDNVVWIVRINLLDYSTEFNKWKKDSTIIINTMATIKLLCQVIVKEKTITFGLKESGDKIYLKECSDNNLFRFYLNMFLHFYNEKKLLFLFDGFDEICPDYRDEVIQFLQVVKNFPKKNKIWITSRSFNPMPSLQRNFGRAYKMQSFSNSEQTDFLLKFWESKFMAKMISEDNVKSFLDFMLRNISEIDYKLRVVCYYFYNLIISKFPCLIDEVIQNVPELKLKIRQMSNAYEDLEEPAHAHLKSDLDKFMGTPILLCLAGEYFVNEVLDTHKLYNKKSNFSTLSMYENFVENNLKKNIHDKYGMNTDVPYFKDKFTTELIECMTVYKKIGAHVIFGSPIFSKLSFCFEEFKNMTPFYFNEAGQNEEYIDIISRLRKAKEKTGLISYVTYDNTPIFIHKTFAEYFAFEFVCDVLKSKNYDFGDKKLLWIVFRSIISNNCDTAILNTWTKEKLKMDKGFNDVVQDIEKKQPFIDKYVHQIPKIKKQYANRKGALHDTLLQCAYVRLLNSTQEDFEDHLFFHNNIEDYLSRRRKLDNDLINVMKPHLKKYFPVLVSRPIIELIAVV